MGMAAMRGSAAAYAERSASAFGFGLRLGRRRRSGCPVLGFLGEPQGLQPDGLGVLGGAFLFHHLLDHRGALIVDDFGAETAFGSDHPLF